MSRSTSTDITALATATPLCSLIAVIAVDLSPHGNIDSLGWHLRNAAGVRTLNPFVVGFRSQGVLGTLPEPFCSLGGSKVSLFRGTHRIPLGPPTLVNDNAREQKILALFSFLYVRGRVGTGCAHVPCACWGPLFRYNASDHVVVFQDIRCKKPLQKSIRDQACAVIPGNRVFPRLFLTMSPYRHRYRAQLAAWWARVPWGTARGFRTACQNQNAVFVSSYLVTPFVPSGDPGHAPLAQHLANSCSLLMCRCIRKNTLFCLFNGLLGSFVVAGRNSPS
jgi:hypothetical protein